MQSTESGERGTESIPNYFSQAEEDTQNFWEAISKGQGKCTVNLQRFFAFRIIFSQLNPCRCTIERFFTWEEKEAWHEGRNIGKITFFRVSFSQNHLIGKISLYLDNYICKHKR